MRPRKRPTHGGARKGAGRKPGSGRRRVSHARRPAVVGRFPLHITVRMQRDLPGLRNFERARVLYRAFVRGCTKAGFRICQFSIQGNHIHLIVEAASAEQLARGMQGWGVRVARGINGELGREGRVLDDRYHARSLKTPSEVRNALCYVLQNARRHDLVLDPKWHGVDAFSSAWWFDGWAHEHWRRGLVLARDPPVAAAQSWLLTTGWRRRGLIRITEGPPAAAR
jgi:REP element-mobilizing transposase RayT